MFTGKIEKVSDNKNDLRTKSMSGTFVMTPRIGKSFAIFGKPLDPDSHIRMIRTSPVVEILNASLPGSSMVLFKTENSTYSLTEIEEEEVQQK